MTYFNPDTHEIRLLTQVLAPVAPSTTVRCHAQTHRANRCRQAGAYWIFIPHSQDPRAGWMHTVCTVHRTHPPKRWWV